MMIKSLIEYACNKIAKHRFVPIDHKNPDLYIPFTAYSHLWEKGDQLSSDVYDYKKLTFLGFNESLDIIAETEEGLKTLRTVYTENTRIFKPHEIHPDLIRWKEGDRFEFRGNKGYFQYVTVHENGDLFFKDSKENLFKLEIDQIRPDSNMDLRQRDLREEVNQDEDYSIFIRLFQEHRRKADNWIDSFEEEVDAILNKPSE